MNIAPMITAIVKTRRQRQASIALAALSERQLDDLGISRIDVLAARSR